MFGSRHVGARACLVSLAMIGGGVAYQLGCASSDPAPDGTENSVTGGDPDGGGTVGVTTSDSGPASNLTAPDAGGAGCDPNALDLTGCPCAAGTERSCFAGGAGSFDAGACKMGTQTCQGGSGPGEFKNGTWGACGGQSCTVPCDAGTVTFAEAGAATFTVPGYASLTVKVWGAGGGGAAYGQSSSDVPTAGGASSFNGTITAGGGQPPGQGSAGGTASGGATNTNGGAAAGTAGGASPNGGAGGNTPGVCPDNPGSNGTAPGGGGGGDWICQGQWQIGQGWGYPGSGGGGGAYASMTYASGQLTAGASVPIVVGASGHGGSGPGGFGGSGSQHAGDGAQGQVTITWTCPPQ